MRKNLIIAFIIGGLCGTGAGFGLGILLFPFIFSGPVATETVDADSKTLAANGTSSEGCDSNNTDPATTGHCVGSQVFQI